MSEFTLQARRRTVFVIGSLFVLAVALVLRLLDLQLLRHDTLVAKAEEVVMTKIPLRARRGHIYDRVGRPLAVNEKGYVLWVDGPTFDGVRAATSRVGQLCDRQSGDVWREIMSGEAEGFYLCSRWVDPAVAEELQQMVADEELYGIVLEVEPRRIYPYGELLAPVLGYLQDSGDPDANQVTDYSAHGGVEEYNDQLLRGTDGYTVMERDPENFMIPIGHREEHPPTEGANITLTLDLNVQYYAEKLLSKAIEDTDARRGDIIVLDPKTGAILALASWPSFDPSDIIKCANDPACRELMFVDPPIGRLYEPGSTMKIVTMAIALEEHVVRPDSTFECTGAAYVGDAVFHNWNGLGHGHETMGEILLHSCNVGAVTVVQLVKPEAYYSYIDRLGFGRPTGVDLGGEASGLLRTVNDDGWSPVDQAANAFGQAISVSPLQLASAVAAVANGGELMKPYIVAQIEQNGAVTTTLPTLRSQIFHQEVTREVTEMLVAIADIKGKDGGPLIPGYRMAVKTGTAQIAYEDGGGYDPSRTIASAIGYGPVQDPRFLILVRIEGNSVIWGEDVGIPVYRDLATFLLDYFHVPPSEEGAVTP